MIDPKYLLRAQAIKSACGPEKNAKFYRAVLYVGIYNLKY